MIKKYIQELTVGDITSCQGRVIVQTKDSITFENGCRMSTTEDPDIYFWVLNDEESPKEILEKIIIELNQLLKLL